MALPLENLAPSVREILTMKYGPSQTMGWGPRLRSQFNYRTPDDWYEALIFEQVTPDTVWLDVGCGRSMFPRNTRLAEILSQRCHLLVGADPSDNIDANPFVQQRSKCTIEEFETDLQFDLITLRMVAEHIRDPKSSIRALSRLTKAGGLVVIYTVWKWSPASIAAALTPMSFHHIAKRFLWGTQERDTFPVEYRMNTRSKLSALFNEAGFAEQNFFYLDDCRSSHRFKTLNALELTMWRFLRTLGLHYPERCILATYRKQP
jgi:2-polyprenyl-3-methyl-5-hydroxy-6-metoxy-1,4-benzoquinol methylase